MTTQTKVSLITVGELYAARQATWFILGSAVAFLIPYLGVSVLELQHDVYYGCYFATTLVLLFVFVRAERVDVRGLLTRSWIWSLAIGVVVGAAVVRNVFNDPATVRPDGAYYAFELLWRGLGYGTIDALLLTAFPCMIGYNLLHGRINGIRKRAGFIAIMLPLVLVITATYLGYPQYRDDGVRQPETGNVIISLPTLLTANPIGSIGVHASMHFAAVNHAYETPTFLPPQTDA